ncbi:MAG: branched-chain amino acid ABC transporter permease [Firmicutes bacterium]|nr:branched-chain amino acid ABC transporter permease [Bacillota bacterium]
MEQFFQQMVNGITVGSVYALVALGYTMVYGILRMINFAHGEMFMLGSYIALTLLVSQKVNLLATIPNLFVVLLGVFIMSMIVVGGVGVAIERIAYRPLRKAGRLAPIVSALGMSLAVQNAVMLTYGTQYQVFPEGLLPELVWQVAGVEITLMRVVILLISVGLMAALYIFVQKTPLGTAVRATALDHDAARLMGIDVDRIILTVFLIGPALGAAGGIMVGIYYRQVNFTMGWTYGLKAFTAAILGGIGNIPGAMVGGLLLGILETLGAGYISTGWKDAFAFIILITILVVRPTGLLGERVAEKI